MKRDTKPYDTAFKDFAEQDPELLLILVGALPPGATVKLLPREVSAPALLPDQPYEVIGPHEHFLAHIEAQTRYEAPLPERFVDYNAHLWIKYWLPIRSYLLVFLPEQMPAVVPDSATVQAGGFVMTVNYTVVKLWELSAADALATEREGVLPFVPLMRGVASELAQSAQAIAQVADEARRQELALHFVTLGGLKYNRSDLIDLLGRMPMIPLQVLKESSFYQMAIDEGLEKGRAEGLAEGRAEELKNLFRRLAAKRFPGLTLGAELEQVEDLAALEQLCLDLDQVPNAEALRARVAELAAQTA